MVVVRLLLPLSILLSLSGTPAISKQDAKQDPLEQQVADAMLRVKRNDVSGVFALAKRGPSVLVYLEKYMHDPDSNMREAVVEAAGQIQNAESVRILTYFLADNEMFIFTAASQALQSYDCPMLRRVGGEQLKKGLLLHAVDEDGTGVRSILMLGCFKGCGQVAVTLNGLREHTRFQLETDMSLAELDDVEATGRLMQLAKVGTPSTLLRLFRDNRYINDPGLLAALAEHVMDKRSVLAVSIGRSGPNGSTTTDIYVRICDEAVWALGQKTGADLGVPKPEFAYGTGNVKTRYTDAQLAQAYQRLKQYFAKKAVRSDWPPALPPALLNPLLRPLAGG